MKIALEDFAELANGISLQSTVKLEMPGNGVDESLVLRQFHLASGFAKFFQIDDFNLARRTGDIEVGADVHVANMASGYGEVDLQRLHARIPLPPSREPR